jgi:cell division protein FtsL
MFSACVVALFLLVMFYAWQHFSSIEYGYKIEAQKVERDRLVELNRTLKLEAASLRDPGRIDSLARQMGLESPEPGQVIQMNPEDAGAPVMAQATPVAVITAR